MIPADRSFAVHLDSLLGFAQELTTQVHGITKPAGELEGLLAAPVRLGAFNEADSLGATHAAAVAQMRALLADVQEALSFANDVTKTVADGYRRVDADLGAYLGNDGVLNTSNSPSADTILPVSTGHSTSQPVGGIDAGPVAVGGRADGHPGLQLSVETTTVTPGTDGIHIATGDPSTGTSTGITVPLAGQPAAPITGALGTVAGAAAPVTGSLLPPVTEV